MVLIKEITAENFGQFKGLPSNVLVVESKSGPVQMKHLHYEVGIIVNLGPSLFRVQFSYGRVSKSADSVKELVDRLSDLYRFFYIEIKP